MKHCEFLRLPCWTVYLVEQVSTSGPECLGRGVGSLKSISLRLEKPCDGKRGDVGIYDPGESSKSCKTVRESMVGWEGLRIQYRDSLNLYYVNEHLIKLMETWGGSRGLKVLSVHLNWKKRWWRCHGSRPVSCFVHELVINSFLFTYSLLIRLFTLPLHLVLFTPLTRVWKLLETIPSLS